MLSKSVFAVSVLLFFLLFLILRCCPGCQADLKLLGSGNLPGSVSQVADIIGACYHTGSACLGFCYFFLGITFDD
jgi:hypothetical protein